LWYGCGTVARHGTKRTDALRASTPKNFGDDSTLLVIHCTPAAWALVLPLLAPEGGGFAGTDAGCENDGTARWWRSLCGSPLNGPQGKQGARGTPLDCWNAYEFLAGVAEYVGSANLPAAQVRSFF
jgi:hypothetical protein